MKYYHCVCNLLAYECGFYMTFGVNFHATLISFDAFPMQPLSYYLI